MHVDEMRCFNTEQSAREYMASQSEDCVFYLLSNNKPPKRLK